VTAERIAKLDRKKESILVAVLEPVVRPCLRQYMLHGVLVVYVMSSLLVKEASTRPFLLMHIRPVLFPLYSFATVRLLFLFFVELLFAFLVKVLISFFKLVRSCNPWASDAKFYSKKCGYQPG